MRRRRENVRGEKQRSRWKVVREGKKEEGNEREKGEEEREEVREVERERTKK